MASSTKYICLTHGQKQRLREHFLGAARAGMTHRELAEWAVATFKLLHAPSRMTLHRALKSPPEGDTIRPTVKTNRRVCSKALEENLLKWIQACETWQLPIVTCATIQGMAAKIREEIVAAAPESADKALQAMNFSRGWLCKFQRRHNLTSKRVSGEAASVDSTVVEAGRTSLQRVTQAFAKCDVFNLDESAFFYCAPPSKTITAQPIKGRKASKKRITVAIACNADETTKLPLLFVGHTKGVDDNAALPDLAASVQRYDACHESPCLAAARHDEPLSNVTLQMLPPNTTASLQPQDAGIIRQFKAQVLKRQTRHVVDWFDNFLGRAGEEVSSSRELNKVYDVDVLLAMRWAQEAWESVTPATISNCWRHTQILDDDMYELVASIDKISL